jgi:hypothetical protein
MHSHDEVDTLAFIMPAVIAEANVREDTLILIEARSMHLTLCFHRQSNQQLTNVCVVGLCRLIVKLSTRPIV